MGGFEARVVQIVIHWTVTASWQQPVNGPVDQTVEKVLPHNNNLCIVLMCDKAGDRLRKPIEKKAVTVL